VASFSCSRHPSALHSFPTRRSSDLLSLLAPRALAAALPGLALNLMSLDPILVNHRSQYVSFVLPFLALAAVDGGARLQAWSRSRSEEHTSELQSLAYLVCRLLREKK